MTQAFRSLLVATSVLAAAEPAAAQYRRQVEELAPMYAASISVGALFSYDETMTPQTTPLPDDNRRGVREIGTAPWVSAGVRFGRGLAIYASGGIAFPGEAELSGADPLTGTNLEGTSDVGAIWMVSGGASFSPLREAMGLRLEVGPAWLDLGDGGSYLAARISASAKFLEIGDRGGVLVGWDGYFAGGQHDRDEIEYQIRKGMISGVRVGFEMAY